MRTRITVFATCVLLGGCLPLGGCKAILTGEGSIELGIENRNVLVIRHRVAEGNEATSQAETQVPGLTEWIFGQNEPSSGTGPPTGPNNAPGAAPPDVSGVGAGATEGDSAPALAGITPGPLVYQQLQCERRADHVVCELAAWTDGEQVQAASQAISADYAGAFVKALPGAFTSAASGWFGADTLFYTQNAALNNVKIGAVPTVLGGFEFNASGDGLPTLKRCMFLGSPVVRVWNSGKTGYYSPVKWLPSEWRP